MFYSRTTPDAFCSTNHPTVAASDLRAVNRTAQSNVADLV